MTKEYSMKAGAVIVAAGEGSRMGMGGEKLFTRVGGVPLLALTLKAYQGHPGIGPIVLVASKEVQKRFDRELRRHYGLSKVLAVVAGGRRRQDSVYKGLLAFPSPPPAVLIHDGDRPFVDDTIISAVLEGAADGGAIAAVRAKDTIKRVTGEGMIVATLVRSELWLAQTPQGFPYRFILNAHQSAQAEGWEVTDDASLVERLGVPVRVVEGSYDNIKITTPEDLELAKVIYKRRSD